LRLRCIESYAQLSVSLSVFTPLLAICGGKPLEGLRLWLRFSDGREGVVALEAPELPVQALGTGLPEAEAREA
jgi:hypothetical protein